jgi:hypothetical protein
MTTQMASDARVHEALKALQEVLVAEGITNALIETDGQTIVMSEGPDMTHDAIVENVRAALFYTTDPDLRTSLGP